jgi:hypothetical protein
MEVKGLFLFFVLAVVMIVVMFITGFMAFAAIFAVIVFVLAVFILGFVAMDFLRAFSRFFFGAESRRGKNERGGCKGGKQQFSGHG